ncbi:DUF1428 domain-containing protein [Salinimonas marina]|uniref:DUF1428 domain-containing protein n=1 Tax=Salinimonas marina TaxID=2785918 RepID=A0A7S9DV46_9ALTE|nr:DUF1428 domain-containing protein [Salinimonas marina]QPG04494.1 DUF1428 domain-containing protein [Salinimonas marina]
MTQYIDGFVLPVPRKHLDEYASVAGQVAKIWKEYGALAYFEFVGDDLTLTGTRSFLEVIDVKENEVIVFGWTLFPTKQTRDRANAKVPNDPRMTDLVSPLTNSERVIFDAQRMVFGGFRSLLPAPEQNAG